MTTQLSAFIGLWAFFCSLLFNENTEIARFEKKGFNPNSYKVRSQFFSFNDTLMCDTLFVYEDSLAVPAVYSRKISTGVCVEGECRRVKMEIFWHLTGRYMGFRLPDDEFLSKTKHVRFNEQEYDKIHKILGDRYSPLSRYAIEELVPAKSKLPNRVDAITSATISAVLNDIVPGAVYTTWTLWHIVNGNTQSALAGHTAKNINNQLIKRLLKSDEISDVAWTFEHFPKKYTITPEIFEILMEYIAGSDAFLCERALNAIEKENLTDEIQIKLARTFFKVDYIQKRFIVQKLATVENLNISAAEILSEKIDKTNAVLIKSIIALFSQYKIESVKVNQNIAPLLKNKNRYISEIAYKFIENSGAKNNSIIRKLKSYKN